MPLPKHLLVTEDDVKRELIRAVEHYGEDYVHPLGIGTEVLFVLGVTDEELKGEPNTTEAIGSTIRRLGLEDNFTPKAKVLLAYAQLAYAQSNQDRRIPIWDTPGDLGRLSVEAFAARDDDEKPHR